MPFWKKSEDPWDWEPERTRPRETESAPQTPPDEERQDDGGVWKAPWASRDTEEQSPPPMKCPWCGRTMRLGYLVGGRDLVRVLWEKPGAFRLTDPDGTLYLRGDGGFWSDHKLAWHCASCRKLVVDTTDCDRADRPSAEEPNRRIIYGTGETPSDQQREEP